MKETCEQMDCELLEFGGEDDDGVRTSKIGNLKFSQQVKR